MSERSRVLRNTLFSSAGMYVEYVLGMLVSILIARSLGPDGMGRYSLMIWLVSICVAVINAGTASAAIKFVAELRGSGRIDLAPVLIRQIRRIQRAFLLMVMLVFAVALWRMDLELADHPLLWSGVVLGLSIVLRAAYMLNVGIAKGMEDFRSVAKVMVIAAPVNFLLVGLVAFLDPSVELFLGVFFVSSVVFYLLSRRMAQFPAQDVAQPLPPELRGRLVHHIKWTAMTVTLGLFSMTEIEVPFLALYDSTESAGYFKVAFQLASGIAMLVPGVFGALLLPMMAHAISQSQAAAGRKFVATTSYLTILSAPLAAFGIVLGGAVIQFLYGSAYAAAGIVFSVCLAGVLLGSVSQAGSSLLISADRQRTFLVLVAVCALIKVLLNYVLILNFGLSGAMAAFFLSAMVGDAAIVVLAMRQTGMRLEFRRLAKVLLAAALAGFAAYGVAGNSPPLLALMLGSLVLAGVYGLSILLLGCLNRGDIEFLQNMNGRFDYFGAGSRARFLTWLHSRSAS